MNWFYAKNGSQQGPLSTDEIKSRIAMGEIGPDDLAWSEGMADWMPVGQISQLKIEAPVKEELPPPPVGVAPAPYQPPSAPSPAPVQGMPGQAPSQGLAVASLVCGILSVIACCTGWLAAIVAIVAVVLGHIAISKNKQSPATHGGKGMARAGLVLGYLGLIVAIIVTVASIWALSMTPEQWNELLKGMPEEQRKEFLDRLEEAKSRSQPQ